MGRWVDGTNDQASDVPRITFFYNFLFLRALKTLFFMNFEKSKRINWNDFCKELCKKLWKKKIILGTSDTWLLSQLSQRPSNPAYYIEDCRIFGCFETSKHNSFLVVLLFCVSSGNSNETRKLFILFLGKTCQICTWFCLG